MTLRDRLRKWLGIESDLAGLKSTIELDVQNMVNGAIRSGNTLREDLTAATETFDAIKMEWWNRFSDERQVNSGVFKAIRGEIDLHVKATEGLSKSAKEGYSGASAALKVFEEHFSQELTRIDGLHYGSIRELENRAAVIEGALAGIICPTEENPSAERERAAKIVEEFRARGFKFSDKVALVKKIRGEQ